MHSLHLPTLKMIVKKRQNYVKYLSNSKKISEFNTRFHGILRGIEKHVFKSQNDYIFLE